MRGHESRHFIYFAMMPCGSVKIGCSTQVSIRIRNLKADLLHVIEGSTFRESALHFLLRKSCIGGEMFAYDDAVKEFIRKSKLGDYGGLISEVPRIHLRYQKDAVRNNPKALKPFKLMREAAEMTADDVANGASVSFATAVVADGQTAPFFLSGRLAQFMIGRLRDKGVYVDSHHLTGLYTEELVAMLPKTRIALAAAIEKKTRGRVRMTDFLPSKEHGELR